MQTIMENDCGEVLGEIIRKLSPLFEKRHSFRREVLTAIAEISTKIPNNPPSADEFSVFCMEIHDWLVKFDSPLRAMLLRVLRLCTISPGKSLTVFICIYTCVGICLDIYVYVYVYVITCILYLNAVSM
jgi:hypothetical protein